MTDFNIYFFILQRFKKNFNNRKNKIKITEELIDDWNLNYDKKKN